MCLNCILLNHWMKLVSKGRRWWPWWTDHQNAKLFVDGSKINEPCKNLMMKDVCDCKNRIWHGTLLCQLPRKHGALYLLECMTEPCMIEIVEYIPTMTNHWQVNVNNSHFSYGRIHWHSKCINPCTCSPFIHSKMISKASNCNTKSNSDKISCIILFGFAENYKFVQNAS